MGNGVKLEINGNNIVNAQDVDLAVKTETDIITNDTSQIMSDTKKELTNQHKS